MQVEYKLFQMSSFLTVRDEKLGVAVSAVLAGNHRH